MASPRLFIPLPAMARCVVQRLRWVLCCKAVLDRARSFSVVCSAARYRNSPDTKEPAAFGAAVWRKKIWSRSAQTTLGAELAGPWRMGPRNFVGARFWGRSSLRFSDFSIERAFLLLQTLDAHSRHVEAPAGCPADCAVAAASGQQHSAMFFAANCLAPVLVDPESER